MMYQPDEWQLVKINGTDPHYRVFAGWRGGFADGDRWKLNSGIVSAELDAEDYWLFHGHSGSTYRCYKNNYGIRGSWLNGVMNDLCDKSSGTAEVMTEMPDIKNMVW